MFGSTLRKFDRPNPLGFLAFPEQFLHGDCSSGCQSEPSVLAEAFSPLAATNGAVPTTSVLHSVAIHRGFNHGNYIRPRINFLPHAAKGQLVLCAGGVHDCSKDMSKPLEPDGKVREVSARPFQAIAILIFIYRTCHTFRSSLSISLHKITVAIARTHRI